MRKLALYGIIIFQVLMIVSLVRGIQLSRMATGRIKDMETVKNKLVDEKNNLLKQQEYVQSDFYLEKVARDELHLSKEGETVVVVPEMPPASAEGTKNPEESVEKKNWQKWLEVIFYSN